MSGQGERDREALARHYARLAEQHGDDPRAGQWSSRSSQDARLSVLIEIGDLTEARLLDFGCGTGRLLDLLRGEHGFAGSYVGYDLADAPLEVARRRHPDARFEVRDVLRDPPDEDFDYVLASGVFNNRISDNWAAMTETLAVLFRRTRVALGFNCMSSYVDYLDDGLWYVDPGAVLDFCKRSLSPAVTLRHDYLTAPEAPPVEFTTFVYRSDHEVRGRHPEVPAGAR